VRKVKTDEVFELSRFSDSVLFHLVLVSLPTILILLKLFFFFIGIVIRARLVAEAVSSFEEVRSERQKRNCNLRQVLQDDADDLLSPGSIELVESIADWNAETLLSSKGRVSMRSKQVICQRRSSIDSALLNRLTLPIQKGQFHSLEPNSSRVCLEAA